MSEYGTDIDLDMYPVSNTTISDTTYNVSSNENANEPNFANNLIVSGGTVNINNAVYASNNTIGNGGTINVSAMGPILDTIISSGGVLEAKVAQLDNTIIYSGGEMNISSVSIGEQTAARAVANDTKVSGGAVNVGSGGSISGASIFSGGVINAVNVASIESDVTVYDGGVLIAGGLGEFVIENTGIGNIPTSIWYYNGQNIVSSGGVMSVTGRSVDDTVASGGNLYVLGLTESTIINSKGNVYVSTGGSATTNQVLSGGLMVVLSGGSAIDNNIFSGGKITVSSGASAVDNIVSSGGVLYISSGGAAVGNTIQKDAYVEIEKGATFSGNNIIGGDISFLGGDLSNTTINSGVVMTLSSGGNAVGNTVNSQGYLFLMNANASNTTLNKGGDMTIAGINDSSYQILSTSIISAAVNVESATAIDTILNGGIINVGPDANVYNVQAMNGGFINIYDSTGYVSNATILSGGHLTAFGVAEGVTISSTGSVVVGSGGSAVDNVLSSGATLYVSSGGSALGTVLSSGATLYVSSGGFITGTILSSGAVLSMDSGAFATGNTWNSGSIIVAQNGASFVNNNVSGGIIEAPGGYLSNTLIDSDGSVNLGSSAIAVDNTIQNSGYVFLDSGSIASNNVIHTSGGLTVVSGIISKTTIDTSGFLNVSGGTATSNIVGNQGLVILYDGATLDRTTINGGRVVDFEGNVTSSLVASGGSIEVYEGSAENNIISSGGLMTISTGASAVSNSISSGGRLTILAAGASTSIVGNSLYNGGILSARSGVILKDTTLYSGAQLTIVSGVSAIGNTLYSGGILSVQSGGLLQNTTIYSGGSAVLGSGASLDGTVTLEKGGYLAITTSTGGTVDFTDATTPVYLASNATLSNVPSGLVISGTGNATTVISGFSGTSPEDSDKITLANVKQSDVTQVTYPDADHVTFDLQNGSTITLNVIGVQDKGFALGSDANGALTYEVCFLTGTLISMVNGVCAVEDIQVGDKVAVYHPQTQKKSQRKVTWVGKKTAHVKPARFDDEAGYPVRILKNAIADNVPNKDLLVTAEHCLFFNGAFTPARMLVNGRSIFYDRTITSYDYYHIETEKHSVIMADGMLTESYLDTGNRHLFVPAQKVVSLKGRRWDKDAAAPLMVERSVVEPLYREIAERADAMDFEYQADPVQTTNDADLHLITDKGQTIRDKLISQDGRVVFIIPAHTKSVRIASRIRRLSNMVGSFVDDRNYAGLLIGDMYVSDSQGVRLFNVHTRVDDLDGWHANEEESRWTKGNALLPLDQLGDFDMPIYLSMHILDGGPYILEEYEEEQKQLA